MSLIWSILGFVVVIGILVIIHEWGHYQVARWFNIKVLTFSIGFGKPIWQKQVGETQFQLALLPLGGFVKFVDEADGPVAEEDLPRAFNRQSVYKRFAVVAAGPIVNLLFAWLAFTLIYLIGVSGIKPLFNTAAPQSALEVALENSEFTYDSGIWQVVAVNGSPVFTWMNVREALLKAKIDDQTSVSVTLQEFDSGQYRDVSALSLADLDLDDHKTSWLRTVGFEPYRIPVPAKLGVFTDGGPAQKAGLQSGDEVIAIDGLTITTWQDLVQVVSERPNQWVEVQYLRDGMQQTQALQLDAKPNAEGGERGFLGVGVDVSADTLAPYTVEVRYGLVDSLQHGWDKNFDFIDMSLTMLKKMLFGEVGLSNLSGPISIAQFSGQAIQSSLVSFLTLLGLLSLSLGILNLLPIPVLDGGHLAYYIVEMIKGSPVSEQAMLIGQKIGLFILLSLTVLALTNDLVRITHG